ncbi:MAG: hypothetical protein JW969_19695 [Spirochaetales bacterium]|nr:hypothetical protein [Spirochaetales bacterium]
MTDIINNGHACLLLNDYGRVDDLKDKILSVPYTPADPVSPTCRFRGTLIDFRKGTENPVMTGWQRNVARLRKLDVSLPTIVTIALDENGLIREAELDASFKGSKGLLCSHKYLNANLKKQLIGRKFGEGFLRAVKLEKMHCAHIFEVLSGLYSCYRMLEDDGFGKLSPVAYEEEAIDSTLEGGTLHSFGLHLLKGKPVVEYRLSLDGFMDKISFARDGTMRTTDGVRAGFMLDGKEVLAGTVTVNTPGTSYMDLTKFLLICIRELGHVMGVPDKIRMLNTNLYPGAYIGMLIQFAAIRIFNSNYSYIMHALTALQRPAGISSCIGAVSNQEEADRVFPGYDLSDIV